MYSLERPFMTLTSRTMSCRSFSIGTILIATTVPVRLCTALWTDPYDLRRRWNDRAVLGLAAGAVGAPW